MMSLNQRLDLIEPKILEKNFRTGRGTANEVNFWIFDYPPEDELAVRSYVDSLVGRINGKQEDIHIKIFDLYNLLLDVLREKNYLDKVKKMEADKGSSEIINPLKRTLRLTEDDDMIIKKIAENLTLEKDVIFITGVGKAWPIIRSHIVLNNLHSKVDRNPLVMFFPGEYTDELKLLDDISDGNYYRAFKLI